MPTKEQVSASLESVLLPDTKRSVIGMNLVRDILINDFQVDLKMASTGLSGEVQAWIKSKAEELIGKLPGVNSVTVEFSDLQAKEINKVDHTLAIMSGKGGVGKSLVSGLVAVALKRQGREVGILDADITGPSIPKMFGISGRPTGSETGIMPVVSKTGIELMSINLLLPSEEDAVIWRGPLIGKTITQFWEDVLWGSLDYLIVDLPPGTADAPLTVLQSLPISGIIIVFTPQDLTAMVVRKAVNMARQMNKPILGVVENMSYLYVPEIDKKIEIFGKSKGEEMAQSAGAPFLGQLPIDPELAALCDAGDIELYHSDSFEVFVDNLNNALPKVAK